MPILGSFPVGMFEVHPGTVATYFSKPFEQIEGPYDWMMACGFVTVPYWRVPGPTLEQDLFDKMVILRLADARNGERRFHIGRSRGGLHLVVQESVRPKGLWLVSRK